MSYHLRDDQYQRLVVFHERAGRLSDSEALMALADNAFQEEFGHKLFTLLKVDRAAGVMRRIYSTDLITVPSEERSPSPMTSGVGVSALVGTFWAKIAKT
ncbi:hypothetical protein [Rhizobium sp. CCGE531]|uniref:hypothetical protein n=1 Tax=Rhizobium sp. CCGE531 TaxID=2364271 RepID=UPI001FE01DE7|nr:hypothetical protein [Rhizobium sp. CCGE531]